ncbi:MAG: peptidyl-tRNA hydrolase, family [Thermomicrobiales bacterium]|nr:peptidyl-tRNA hydrolase, family [Thermomicrobiales bacterium]
MKIVVGLGNPGREYTATRHNVGFMVVNRLARLAQGTAVKKRFRSEIVEGMLDGEKLVLVAPQTYMNLSGHAVREVVNWYHLPVEELIVVADDLDLPFGTLRMRARGSAGGHNGLASIIEQLGTQDVPRLKIGIGRGPGSASARVLSRFSPEEDKALSDVIDRAAAGVRLWAHEGVIVAMNDVNRRAEPEASAVGKTAGNS